MSHPPQDAALVCANALFRLVTAKRSIEVVQSALSMGLLERLRLPATLSELGVDFGVSTLRMGRFVEALCALDVVERRGDGTFLSTLDDVVLRGFMRDRNWVSLLKSGPGHRADTARGADKLYPAFVKGLSDFFRSNADQAAQLMARPGLRVLEVGAGAAPWSQALVRREPTIAVCANDLPAVLDTTRTLVDRAGLADSYSWMPGDFFQLDLPIQAFDQVLVPQVLHLFGAQEGQTLVERSAACVAPGGDLVLIDIFREEDPLDPGGALYDLDLLSRTLEGGIPDRRQVTRWVEALGLVDIRYDRLLASPRTSLLRARRPQ